MEDRRWIRKDSEHKEQFTVRELHYLVKSGKIGHWTPFWSERRQAWLPLTHLLHDTFGHDGDRLAKMRAAGIKYVKITGSGNDCDACRKLDHRIYSIDTVPELPPSDCTCNPWCGCLVIAQPFERG
jgi:hypothetical protein